MYKIGEIFKCPFCGELDRISSKAFQPPCLRCGRATGRNTLVCNQWKSENMGVGLEAEKTLWY